MESRTLITFEKAVEMAEDFAQEATRVYNYSVQGRVVLAAQAQVYATLAVALGNPLRD